MGNCNDGKCFEANILIFLKRILEQMNTGGSTKDIEISIVKDADNVLWLEVRKFNVEDSSNTILYFKSGTDVPGSPVEPLTYDVAGYDNFNTLLTNMLNVLGQINIITGNIDNTLTTLNDLFDWSSTPLELGIDVYNMPGVEHILPQYRSASILFEGNGGKIQGHLVPSGYILDLDGGDFSTIEAGITITVPTTIDTDRPSSPRVVITKLT